jgi:hypothetical protein
MWEQGIDWGDEDQSKGWDVVVVICSHHQWNSCKSLCEEAGHGEVYQNWKIKLVPVVFKK